MRIFVVTNQKGGVGKTTTAVNLATALAAIGKKTIIIDIDPQGNASTGLGLAPRERKLSTYDLLMGETTISRACKTTEVPNLTIIPADVALSGAEIELIDLPSRHNRLAEALARNEKERMLGTGKEVDYVIIDCPPAFSLLTINGLCAAQAAIVPIQCEFFALEGLSQIVQRVRDIKSRFNATLTLHGVLLTMYDRRNNLSREVEQNVRSYMGDLVYKTVIPRNVRISEAPSHGKPALLYDMGCSGSLAYIRLAGEIVKRENMEVKHKGIA